MNIFNCDAGQAAGNCAYRLCWNIDYGLAGYRVGCLENLNSDANRRTKEIKFTHAHQVNVKQTSNISRSYKMFIV